MTTSHFSVVITLPDIYHMAVGFTEREVREAAGSATQLAADRPVRLS